MKLHSLSPIRRQKSQRIGRGGKRGTTSGRGQKGQKSRAGHRIRPMERDLILKIPKRRGFRNKSRKKAVAIFNLETLSRKLKTFVGTEPLVINVELLKTVGLLSKNFEGEVKILGEGEIIFPISVATGVTASKSAVEKINKVKH